MNLDQAFQVVVGTSSRSLFVYSDTGGSSVVGNQVTDLLREANYRRKGQGIQYFEPLHVQYIPYARRSCILSRYKGRRQRVIWSDLAKEVRSSPCISSEHERWKFDTVQIR